ncbi:MAG: UDP-N-acetylglucosamine 1-carboxyvinyltransferase [Nitrospinae bacterium]|nr:UDP-N-acetylglucosamine 1-carboxyvinyltransferase [Nitrospinota bacterium]
MDKILINGGNRLSGTIEISGAKNAALPVLFSSILTGKVNTISNVPGLADIKTTVKLLEHIGCRVNWNGNTMVIDSSTINSHEASYDLVRTMRASCLMMGPLLSRFGEAKVSLPGGCAIGARPINLHLKAFEEMGAEITIEHGYVHAKAKKLCGAKIYFDTVTVTGTENVMMAAVMAEGETILENAAMEPEIVNLANALNSAGAKIEGAGDSIIKISGVKELKDIKEAIIPDRVETGTYLVAGAITNGELTITKCNPHDLEIVLSKLKEMGAEIKIGANEISIKAATHLKSVKITTTPHPGFPTDMQAQFMVPASLAKGTSVFNETVFENRFMHVAELIRMGAEISIDGHTAIVTGERPFSGASVMATDLRASASLVLAGLVADGTTEINRIYHLDRGYEKMEEKLKNVGADIKRVKAS